MIMHCIVVDCRGGWKKPTQNKPPFFYIWSNVKYSYTKHNRPTYRELQEIRFLPTLYLRNFDSSENRNSAIYNVLSDFLMWYHFLFALCSCSLCVCVFYLRENLVILIVGFVYYCVKTRYAHRKYNKYRNIAQHKFYVFRAKSS